jgi:hypothetical protein
MENLGHHQQHHQAAIGIHGHVAFWLYLIRHGRVDVTPPASLREKILYLPLLL